VSKGKFFDYYLSRYVVWFVFFGRGIFAKNTNKTGMTFSEMKGFFRNIKLFGWYFEGLHKRDSFKTNKCW